MLKRSANAFIVNRLHITLSSLAIMWCWSRFLGISFRVLDYCIIVLVVACISQYNRLSDRAEDEINCPDDLADAWRKRRLILAFCYGGGILAALLAVLTDPSRPVLALVASGAAIGYFYNSPLLPSRPGLRLKNLLLVKNLSSGAGWSLGILVFPAVRAHAPLDCPFWIAFAYMFLTVMTYEIMWDIRDRAGDHAAGVITVPVAWGIRRARAFIVLLQAACTLLIGLGLWQGLLEVPWAIFILPSFILSAVTLLFDLEAHRSLSHIMVCGLVVFSLLGGILASWAE
jgi:4-hydroxybenzoate polyprenyltransferase